MKIGDLLVNAAYLGGRVLTAIAVGATKVWEGVSKYIKFKDAVVEQICMKWSSDGIGLTPEDAANVTGIGLTFQGNTEITSFDELQYFQSLQFSGEHFKLCRNLESVRFPKKLNKIPGWCFEGCYKLYDIGQLNVSSVGANGFANCDLRSVIFSNNDATIGNGAFYRNKNLNQLKLPLGLLVIPNSCFTECSGLTIVDIPIGVTRIEVSAFYNCSLIHIDLPPSVEYIGDRAFLSSSLRTSICRAVSPPTLSFVDAFGSISIIYVPDESVELYKNATNWSSIANRIKPFSEYQPTNE